VEGVGIGAPVARVVIGAACLVNALEKRTPADLAGVSLAAFLTVISSMAGSNN
jgi:hypothetical protein